jgi:hypothetical protein
MDGEFEKLKPIMPTIECNTTTAKEHVSKAELKIRTLKERAAIQTHPKESEDRVCLFHHALAEHVPSENGHLIEVLATRAAGEMEIGLQKALPGPTQDLL